MRIYAALDRVISEAARDEGALIAARDAWNRAADKVHDDEPLYEARTSAFLEWFALDGGGAGGGAPTPVERLLAGADGGEDAEALASLAASHRSLFRVAALLPEGCALEDLWGGGRFLVRERRRLAGIEPGDIVDARLVADVDSDDLLFTRTFCTHPREAATAVRRLLERAREGGAARGEVLFQLLRLRVRCERYRNVSPARVYGSGR